MWFKKQKSHESTGSSNSHAAPQASAQPPKQDRHVLYNLGSVVSVSPSERFDIRREKEAHFLLLKGTARLLINGSTLVKTIEEGQWISTLLIPKSSDYFLSLLSEQELKLIQISSSVIGEIEPETRSQINNSIKDIYRDIKKIILGLESQEKSIGEYVRSYLSKKNRAIINQYPTSIFIKKAIDDISNLPMVAQRIIGLTLSDSVSNAEVTAFIKNDPALASQVLRVVNSSYHGLRNKVQDINYAVLYLGLGQIFQLVIAASLQRITTQAIELASVYEHSIIISNVASLLGMPRERRILPVLGTIGILHDVGEIVKFSMKEKRKDLDVLVDQLSGAKLGSMLLDRWQIPESICRAIEIQDQSAYMLPEELSEDVRLAIACLHVAHSVYSFIQDESPVLDPVTRAYLTYLGFAGMNLEQLVRLFLVPELRNNANKLPIEVQVFFSI
ncbi:MAG: HDOD domain-containing protein [Syntrophobacteraceae bacterium]